jgi:hypothetical protein
VDGGEGKSEVDDRCQFAVEAKKFNAGAVFWSTAAFFLRAGMGPYTEGGKRSRFDSTRDWDLNEGGKLQATESRAIEEGRILPRE